VREFYSSADDLIGLIYENFDNMKHNSKNFLGGQALSEAGKFGQRMTNCKYFNLVYLQKNYIYRHEIMLMVL
jgi:hypothetical protein